MEDLDWDWILLCDEDMAPGIYFFPMDDPDILLYEKKYGRDGDCDCEYYDDMYLYRFYGDTDTLLYIGITNDIDRRTWEHYETKYWWPKIERIEYAWVADHRCVAEAVERRAIQREDPVYNVEHSPRHGNYVHPSRP